MKKSSYLFVALLTIAIIGLGVAFNTSMPIVPTKTVKTNKLTKNSKPKKDYVVNTTWNLPKALKEVSGIAWLSPATFACIQDEDGSIYVYDITSKSIIKRIDFAGPGDYEGIAIVNKDAYIMRSDGILFEVTDFQSQDKKVTTFSTGFSIKHNMETLTYNNNTNRLITAPKDEGLKDKNFKSLYEIDLETKIRGVQPFLKIDMNAEAFNTFRKKKAEKTFNPSDAAIHPETKDIYILEGKHPKLVIFTPEGDIKKVIRLNKDEFPQPEGITFSEDGLLYISNEAHKGPATLLEVTIK
ncbi:hypothetical protein ES677_10135 [Bizionia gelidisalsuginis]|uniref:SdiA-regulated family protein n=2 Tax=Bizionia TaxID=283785 RepID=A0A8H2LEZ3_9FLAO|nr:MULTISPECIES: SdiA-regulated domain-containing protein [Bizionia]TYB76129.1 hypothetical protein ES676_06660 [Bizionia saleffrena]TYC11421.1 hypothetical protein ES677_10135 [Bizionia gelidisalsuginis]